MRLTVKILLALGTVGLTAATGTLTAQAAQQTTSDEPPALVESYAYPGAAAILATYGVELISGDGHILYADCTTPAEGNVKVLEVRTPAKIGANGKGRVCFKITGPVGHLELKIPAVYDITGDGTVPGAGHKVKAELTTDKGAHSTVNVAPYGTTPVGAGAKPGNEPTNLLQLDVTP